MNQRRMRLKRGKEGDTGVVIPPALPPAEPSQSDLPKGNGLWSIIQKEWSWDIEDVDTGEIICSVSLSNSSSVLKTVGRHNELMVGRFPPPVAQTRQTDNPAYVNSVQVEIENKFIHHRSIFDGPDVHIPAGRTVTILVSGDGDPRQMLQQATAYYDDLAIVSVSTTNM